MSGPRPAYFRAPAPEVPGTLNASYQVLDKPVVDGHATRVMLAGTDLDHAGVLEQVAAFGGVFTGFGVGPGEVVLVDLDDPVAELVALLAALRIGAIGVVLPEGIDAPGVEVLLDAAGPAVVVTARPDLVRHHRGPRALIVAAPGEPESHSSREIGWEQALRAGRTDPAIAAALVESVPAVLTWGADGVTVLNTGEVAHRLAAVNSWPVPVAQLRAVLVQAVPPDTIAR